LLVVWVYSLLVLLSITCELSHLMTVVKHCGFIHNVPETQSMCLFKCLDNMF